MFGFTHQLTVLIVLLYAVTLPGEAQNYQQRLTNTGYYNPKQPTGRSYSSSPREPIRFDDRGVPVNSYEGATSYAPHHYHNHHGYNHNYPPNQMGPRWTHNSNYPPPHTPYNNYYSNENKFFTERPYPYGFPDLYTERFRGYTNRDKNTDRKSTTEAAVKHPGQFSERNNFNLSLIPVAEHRNTSKRKSDDYDSHRMLFPTEETSPLIRPLNAQNPSRNCSFGLCNIIDDYPADKIKRIISRSKELQQYFENINEVYPVTVAPITINNRFSGDETLCPTMKHTQFPQTAVNTEQIEKYLVNVGDYKQGIVYETCESVNGSCMFAETFPEDYNAVCVQKYTIRRLMTVSKESEQAIFDNFQLPSCCVCTVMREKT